MKPARISTILYLLLVFLSGCLVGFVGSRLYTAKTAIAAPARKSPEEFRKHFVEELRGRLKLDAQQVVSLNRVLEETRQHYRESAKTIQDETVREIQALLSEPQRTEYDKWRAEREKRRKEAFKGK